MKDLIPRGFVIENAACPRCDGPVVYHPSSPTATTGMRRRPQVVCANVECRGTRRVTCEEVFRGPPPQPAA